MEKRLYRDESDKILAGVSSGLAEYFEMYVTWVRIIFVFAAVFGFSGVIIYIILWIVVPPKPFIGSGFNSYDTDYRVPGEQPPYPAPAADKRATPQPPYMRQRENSSNTRLIGGLILIFFGAYFLLEEFDIFPYWLELHRMWPVIFIVLGLLIISRSDKRSAIKEEIRSRDTTVSEEPPAGPDSVPPADRDDISNNDYEKR